MDHYRFWIHNKDDDGHPLDENIVNVAQELGSSLTQYRRSEIDCESTTNAILQSAVEAASKANCEKTIRNPAGYIVCVYRRLVDRFLAEQSRCVSVDEVFLENLANTDSVMHWERAIHDRLMLRKLMDAMDEETRKICYWRLHGYSMNEIAKELSITPNLLSKRYARGIAKAIKNVMEDRGHATQ